jgi:cytoskeletal protein CcmA (bactofilin family)
VNAGALVVADIQARVIVVSGKILGTMSADERIEVRQSAEVEGELSAPKLRVEEGAVVQGKVETTTVRAKAALQLAS